MLIIGSTSDEFEGPREVTDIPIPADGWLLGDRVDASSEGLVVLRVDQAPEQLLEMLEGVDHPVGIVTAPGGFPTMGDIAGLDGEVVPVLDWASVGGIPRSVEGCRAVISFIASSFDRHRIDPIRTRLTVTTMPELGPLASACEIEGVDLVLVLDGVDPARLAAARSNVRSRRLGSGRVDCEPVDVVADGDRWIPLIAEQPLRVSNIDKEFFPDGTTKGDLIEYYSAIADVLLPHLADRPISMSRYPNGIGGASFYEKRSPGHQPEWMQTAKVDSESMGGEIDFLLASDRESLMWFANMGCIEIHPFHSRAADLEHPDYAIFDLDPADGSTWDQVVTVTTMIKTMLDALGLAGYPKLSGSKGMHVYVPLEPGRQDHARVRRFVAAVGELMARANPTDVTVDWKIPNRRGKVFVDANRNASGQTIASVYSVRPRPGAPVSIPITWDEVSSLRNGDVHLGNIAARVAEVGDPFAPVAKGGQTLDAAEERLEIG
jgi:bifunctional non-homologous end joining protein LigD